MSKTGFGVNSCIDRAKKFGVQAVKSTGVSVPVDDIFVPGEGHPLAHPRRDDPLDEALVQSIVRGWKEGSVVTVREDGAPGDKLQFTLIDGSQRINAGKEAQRRTGRIVMVEIAYFFGSDAEAILYRLEANGDPTKRPDCPSVLASTCKQAVSLDASITVEVLLTKMPRGIGRGELEALLRWKNLVPELQPRFDSGELPIGLLGAVLDAPRDQQPEVAERLLGAGVRTSKGASRVVGRDKREASGQSAERVHVKTLDKVVRALDKFTPEVGADPVETLKDIIAENTDGIGGVARNVDELAESMLALGLSLGAKLAKGENILDSLPPNVRAAVEKALAKRATLTEKVEQAKS